MPSEIQHLLELQALQQLKAQYCRYLDTKRWSDWLALFTNDATLCADNAPSGGGRDPETGPTYSGIKAIGDFVVPLFTGVESVHQVHFPEIQLIGDTEASGIWGMEGIAQFPDGSFAHGYGHYHETYRKVDGQWRISTTHLTRLRVVTWSNQNGLIGAPR